MNHLGSIVIVLASAMHCTSSSAANVGDRPPLGGLGGQADTESAGGAGGSALSMGGQGVGGSAPAASGGGAVGGSSSTTISETSSGGANAGGAGQTSTSIDTDLVINGCTRAEALDRSGDNYQVITILESAYPIYSPKCVIVDAGTEVEFMASATHPLVGGKVKNGTQVPDPGSPIKPTSKSKIYVMPVGNYGFYSDNDDTDGMQGAIFVNP